MRHRIIHIPAFELQSDDILVIDERLLARLTKNDYQPKQGDRIRVYETSIDPADHDVHLNLEGRTMYVSPVEQFLLDLTNTYEEQVEK
jgi:hypothetical protein